MILPRSFLLFFFFFNDTATTEIYTLSLHDALPICAQAVQQLLQRRQVEDVLQALAVRLENHGERAVAARDLQRSEEHTSELQSQSNLVCRLLLEKKNLSLIYYVCE